jgi:anti-anti-sigma factor
MPATPTRTATLALTGALDAVTVPACARLITDTLAAVTPGGALVIDLRGLDLLADAGVRALLSAIDAGRTAGVTVHLLVDDHQQIRTVIERVDVDGRLPLVAEAPGPAATTTQDLQGVHGGDRLH